jgi:hypothetical protein
MDLTLDYHAELYSLPIGTEFSLVMATSLSRTGPSAEGTDDRNVWRPREGKTGNLDDDYDYVMYGKVCVSCP